jgi:ribosomal protein S25
MVESGEGGGMSEAEKDKEDTQQEQIMAPWKRAKELIDAGDVDGAFELIEREVPNEQQLPNSMLITRVMVTFALAGKILPSEEEA